MQSINRTRIGEALPQTRAKLLLIASVVVILTTLSIGSAAQTLPISAASTRISPARHATQAVRKSWFSPRLAEEDRIAGLLYVSYAGEAILIYTRSIPNQLIGEITEGICLPVGIAVDAKHRLYVDSFYAECAGYGPSLTIFHQGVAAPGTVIIDGLFDPVTVAVSPKDGTVYTTDSVGQNIVSFARGKTSVKDIIYPLGARPFSVALDRNDVLYASYTDSASIPHVGRYNPASRSFVDLGIPLVFVGPILFDAAGNLLVSDQRTGVISVYPPGSNVPVRSYGGFSDPFAITLDAENSMLYVADLGHRTVEELSYPSGKKLGAISGFTVNTFGVAVTSPTKREAH